MVIAFKKQDGLPVLAQDGREPEAGELVPGPIRVRLGEQRIRLADHADMLDPLREGVGHVFRLVYGLQELGLVKDPHIVIWGRTAPDLQAQALIEEAKAHDKKAADRTKADSAKALIDKYAAKDGDPRLN